jgi:hypothetical protein
MFSGNWFFSKDGAKRGAYSNSAVYPRVNYSGISYNKTAPKRMEAKLILIIAGWLFYFATIYLNIATLKADILWVLAFLFGVVRFIRYCIKTHQDYRKGEVEIKIRQKEIK